MPLSRLNNETERNDINVKRKTFIKQKYNVADMVHRALDAPKNALGQNQNTKKLEQVI